MRIVSTCLGLEFFERRKTCFDENSRNCSSRTIVFVTGIKWSSGNSLSNSSPANLPGVDDENPKLVNPLLKINVLCELLSAIAIFFLVRSCLRRQSRATQSSSLLNLPLHHRASLFALVAASVAWLEPSMILDAHGWPQWDVWILPFYLFAALAALKNRWFLCGCLLAAGAMFKGQLLFVASFFILWPLWQKRWNRALRVLAGFTATTATIASPWLLRMPAAWVALVAVTGASLFLF